MKRQFLLTNFTKIEVEKYITHYIKKKFKYDIIFNNYEKDNLYLVYKNYIKNKNFYRKCMKYIYIFVKYNVTSNFFFRIKKIINFFKIHSSRDSTSMLILLLKYGKIEAKKRRKQRIKDSTVNLNTSILKYGKIEGDKKWKQHCNQISKTRGLEGMIYLYGEKEGTKKWNDSQIKWNNKVKNTWENKPIYEESERLAKRRDTCLKLYNDYKYTGREKIDQKLSTERYINTSVERKLIRDPNLLTEYEKYRRNVNKISNINKKKILETWDGLDYYDNKFIGENWYLNYNHNDYPTLDHKYPVSKGFINKKTIEEISCIENLVMTTRIHNTRKQNTFDYEYFIRLENENK
jgi:hypothetical protein